MSAFSDLTGPLKFGNGCHEVIEGLNSRRGTSLIKRENILKYRNFNNFAESLSSKSSQVIAQEKNEGSRPKAVEGGCFPPQYVL